MRFEIDTKRDANVTHHCWFVKTMLLWNGFMIKMKKISLFALVLAVMLSAGGSCVFPMLTAHASSGAMQMGMDDQSVLDGHEADSMARAPLSQSHVNTCSIDCGQNNNDVVVIKKVKDISELTSLASQGTYVSPSLIDGADLSVLESSETPLLRDTLLTVAKKE